MPDLEPAAQPPSHLEDLFFGDDGLRAGWSLLCAVFIYLLLNLTIPPALHHAHLEPSAGSHSGGLLPGATAFNEGLGISLLCLTCLLMSLIERRPFARYGLSARRMLSDLLSGLAWGVLCLSLLAGVLYLTHSIVFDGVVLHGSQAWAYAGKWGVVFLLVGLLEEFSVRGFLQFTLARGVAGIVRGLNPESRYSHAIGFWVAAFLFSVCLFVAGHLGNAGENIPGLVAVGVVGIVFAFSLYRTGTLWWAIGVHASWDWAQSFLYGTPDSSLVVTGHLLATHPVGSRIFSGGPDGPEGSILCIPVLLLIGAIAWVTLPRRAYPLTPDQAPPLNPLD